MSFLTRFTNGAQVARASLKVLNTHKELIIFPVLSGITQVLILGSFFFFMFSDKNTLFTLDEASNTVMLGVMFTIYLVGYFITVFFNMALVHCARLHFEGKDVSIAQGLSFSFGRIGTILSWALFAASIGTLLKTLQDNFGNIGKLVVGIMGFAWSLATFFVIPVLAYENVGPLEAVKRSASLVKEKWGEGIGANFSIMLLCMLAFIPMAIIAMGVSAWVNEALGIGIFVAGMLILVAISSALHSIFISALYSTLRGNGIPTHFDQQMMDNSFQ